MILSSAFPQAIEDKDLRQRSYRPPRPDQVEAVQAAQVACLLNLALCYARSKQFADSIAACDAVLLMQPGNAKALYRRAQARALPASSGMTEQLAALADLRRALAELPEGKERQAVATLHRRLSKEVLLTKQFEQRHFLGLFSRLARQPDPLDPHEAAKAEAAASDQPRSSAAEEAAEQLLRYSEAELAELVAEANERIDRGRAEQEDENWIAALRDKRRVLLQLLDFRRQQAASRNPSPSPNPNSPKPSPKDFLRPSERMVEEARAFDVDLTDERQANPS